MMTYFTTVMAYSRNCQGQLLLFKDFIANTQTLKEESLTLDSFTYFPFTLEAYPFCFLIIPLSKPL